LEPPEEASGEVLDEPESLIMSQEPEHSPVLEKLWEYLASARTEALEVQVEPTERLEVLKFCDREGLEAVEVPARKPFFRIRKAEPSRFPGNGKNASRDGGSRPPKQPKLVQRTLNMRGGSFGLGGPAAAAAPAGGGSTGRGGRGGRSGRIPVGMSGVLEARIAEAEAEAAVGGETWLFLGSVVDARDKAGLRARGIRYVLNCCSEMDSSWAATAVGARYLRLQLMDEPGQELRPALEAGREFMAQAEREQAAILVHCVIGRSRSASMILYWLMHRHRLRLGDALRFLRSRRPRVGPNPGFLRQLREIERDLFGLSAPEPIDDLLRMLDSPLSPPLPITDFLPAARLQLQNQQPPQPQPPRSPQPHAAASDAPPSKKPPGLT
jgi:hypothetical protein